MGKLFGDWGRARQAIGRLASGESVNSDLKNAMTLGDFIRNLAYEHIDKQDLQWKPLSPFTVKRKGTDKIMVDTGEYKENIVVGGVSIDKIFSPFGAMNCADSMPK